MAHSEYPSMPPTPEKTMQGSKHTSFQPLQQTAFSELEHAAFLKGLLKPFKGKGVDADVELTYVPTQE